MKALTGRQAAALAEFKSGGSIDRGMMAALIRKGALSSDDHRDVPASTMSERHVVYDPINYNKIVQRPGQGAGVWCDAVFANQAAAKAFITRTQSRVTKLVLSGQDEPIHWVNSDYWEIASVSEYQKLDTQVERTNFMTGEKYLEDVNTPHSCSASTETFWSM